MANKANPVVVTVSSAGTTTWPSALANLYAEYGHMDVAFIVNTMVGGAVTMYIQEFMPISNTATSAGTGGGSYVTTAKIAGIATTGVFYATYDDNNAAVGTPYASPSTAKNAMLGKGTLKQIVTTASASSFSVDVIYCFWNP